jgi:hypothetical protein
MVDHRTAEDVERARHHADHVAWLRTQAADLQEHRRSQEPSMRDEEDYAVGAEANVYPFVSGPSFSLDDDDEVRYRSLDFSSAEHAVEVDMADEELVYRSLPMTLGRQTSNASSESSAGADASWLAAGRPPLLQRQRAFNRPSDEWMIAAGLEP